MSTEETPVRAGSGGQAFNATAAVKMAAKPVNVSHIRQIDDVMTQEIEALPDKDPIFKTPEGELCYAAIKGLWTKVWDVFQHTVTDLPSLAEADLMQKAQAADPSSPEARSHKEAIVLQMIRSFELGAKSAALILNT